MSYSNPTPLRIGATGTLYGWTMQVAGRVVLGVELDGTRYYWNEFHLVDAQGNAGTLVYEEGEDGPEWKLFRELTPLKPLTVAEAELKKVGDPVSFGRESIPVTLVDRSTVYHIEGTAPEGVEVGDLADFLNADAGDRMLVVSWTGNEIEYYEGRDVPAPAVATAFGLPRGQAAFRGSLPEEKDRNGSSGRWYVGGTLVTLALISVLAGNSCRPRLPARTAPANATAAPAKQPAAPLRLANGASGQLGARTLTVGGHAVVEIGRVTGRFDRHEYQLIGDGQPAALLINGLTGGTRQWHLLTPVPVPAGFSAFDAANRRRGNSLNLGGTNVTVTELYLSQLRAADGTVSSEIWPPARQFGFVGTAAGEWWLARWNERGLALYRGTALDEPAVLAALGPGPEKPR